MAAAQLMLPANRAFNSNGLALPGATASLFTSGTTTPQNFYSDTALSISAGTTITANAAGRFSLDVYQNDTIPFRLITKDRNGVQLDDIDPFYFGATYGSVLGTAASTFASRTLLAAVTGVAGAMVNLSESGREGQFVWSSANLSTQVTADPQQGIYVAPASAPTGASGAWVRKFSGPVNVKWFGAVGDNVTNDGPAFVAAIAYLHSDVTTGFGYGKASLGLYVPRSIYFLSTSTLDLNHSFDFYGDSVGGFAQGAGSVLRWAANTTGIRTQRPDTTGATGDGVSNYGAADTIIRNLSLQGAFTTPTSTVTITIASPSVVTWNAHGFANGTPITLSTTGALPTGLVAGTTYFIVSASANTFSLAATVGGAAINTSGTQSGVHTAWANTEGEYHGIHLRQTSVVRDVLVSSFQGDGIYTKCNLGNVGSFRGSSSGSIIENVTCQNCRNGVYIEEADANALVITNPLLSSNRRYGLWSKTTLGSTIVGGVIATNGVTNGFTPSIVHRTGHRYYVLPNQEAGAATNAPSGTTANNTWWGYFNDGGIVAGVYPDWFSGITVRAGGVLRLESSFDQWLLSGVYREPDQAPAQIQVSVKAVVVSPMLGDPVTFDGSPYGARLRGDGGGVSIMGGLTVGEGVGSNFAVGSAALNTRGDVYLTRAAGAAYDPTLHIDTTSNYANISFKRQGVEEAVVFLDSIQQLNLLTRTAGKDIIFYSANTIYAQLGAGSGGLNIVVGALKIAGTTIINSSGVLQAVGVPAFAGGDVTSAGGSLTLTIGANKVTRAMMAATAGATILGSTGAGNVTDLTAAQAAAIPAVATTGAQGMMSAQDKTRLDGEWTVYRTLLDSSGWLTAADATGTYGLGHGDKAAVTGTGTQYPLNMIYIAAADYPALGTLNPKLRIRVQVHCNDVAPGATFTFGLHPITRPGTSGGAGLAIYTIGAAVASSTAVITTPAADSSNVAVAGADIALPADGYYALGVVTSVGAIAASAHVHLNAILQMRYA